MKDYYKKFQKDSVVLLIKYDNTCSESPREWDNIGTMAYNHSKYILGDEEIDDGVNWLCQKLGIEEESLYRLAAKNDCRPWSEEMVEILEERFFKQYIALPLYLYDHSGITMNTTGFSCGWDSGKVGYIYASKEDLKKEYKCKIITKSIREKALAYMEGEVKTFDDYITGTVFGFQLYLNATKDDYGDCDDGCWGFYGDDMDDNGLWGNVGDKYQYLKDCEVS